MKKTHLLFSQNLHLLLVIAGKLSGNVFIKVMVPPKTRQLYAIDQSKPELLWPTRNELSIQKSQELIWIKIWSTGSLYMRTAESAKWAANSRHGLQFIKISEQGVSLTHVYRQTFLEVINTRYNLTVAVTLSQSVTKVRNPSPKSIPAVLW